MHLQTHLLWTTSSRCGEWTTFPTPELLSVVAFLSVLFCVTKETSLLYHQPPYVCPRGARIVSLGLCVKSASPNSPVRLKHPFWPMISRSDKWTNIPAPEKLSVEACITKQTSALFFQPAFVYRRGARIVFPSFDSIGRTDAQND